MAATVAGGILSPACLAAPAAVQPAYRKAADNPIFAQTLVNQLMADNPDLISVGIHARPPGGGPFQVIAHSQDIIGKRDDDIDAEIIKGDQTVLGIETVGKTAVLRMVVHEGLHDQSGKVIGMVVLSFKFRPEFDKTAALARAEPLMRDLAARIPSSAALFEPEGRAPRP